MKNDVEPEFLNQLDTVFAQLNPQAVEEFYAAYRQWCLRQRITELRHRIDAVREQQTDNQQRLRETRPATIALAALARLQSNGVSDNTLLDAMLKRGESWLDQTMQRLDYFEQFDDFISDDYTKWCQGALEGAFDWIDSLLESTEQAASPQVETPPAEEMPHNKDAGDVEALLLQRLATEDEQDDLSWQEATTLKRMAIKALPSETVTTDAEEQEPPETVTTDAEEQEQPAPEDVARRDAETQVQETDYIPLDEPAQSDDTPNALADVVSSTNPEEQIIPEEALLVEDTPVSEPEQPALVEFAPIEETAPGEEEFHTGDNQPTLIESAPIEEPSLTQNESELYTVDQQPALIEFAAPSELSPAEDTSNQVAEQPTEITLPEDTSTAVAAQSEVNEPDEMENGASEETPPHEEQVIPASKPITPARSAPRKRGLVRTLLSLLTGK